jgi:hypothetical protein
MPFNKGDKLNIITRHQDTKKFGPASTIGVVEKSSEENPERMKVRVYRPDDTAEKGYLHEFMRVSETIWLERIGRRTNADGTTNLPSVHEIMGKISDDQFATRHAALQPRRARRK